MSIEQGVLREIYARLDVGEMLPELSPQDKGSYFLLNCPACGKREAYLYKNGKRIKCNRESNCRYSNSLWDYLQARTGYSNKEVLEYMARIAGYPLPELGNDAIAKAKAEHDTSDLLQEMMNFFRMSLHDAQDVQDYLAKRGYAPSDIETMGLGYYPGKQATRQYLLENGYSEKQLETVNALSEDERKNWNREDYKLVFAYKSPSGYIKGIWGRITRPLREGEKESRKYLPFLETDRETPFGYRYGMKEIIIVEGYLDCLLGQAKGGFPLIAAGSNRLSQAQIDFLKKVKPPALTIAFDNDHAGHQGTLETIQKLGKSEIKCYVARNLPDNYKDIDELLTKTTNGKEIFQFCLDNALSTARWTAKYLAKTIDPSTDKSREQLFEKLLSLANVCTSPMDRQAVMNEISVLGMDESEISGYVDSIQQRQAQQERRKAYECLLAEAKSRLFEGIDIGKMLQESATEIENAYQKVVVRARQDQSERIKEL